MPKKKNLKIYGSILIIVSLCMLLLPKIYDVVVNSGKNKYTLTAPEIESQKSATSGVMLTVAVYKPKKETIMITSENRDGRNWLGGDNIEEFLSTSHPELASEVKFVDNGIQLAIKPSDKKVVLKIPVSLPDSTTTTFKIKRDRYTVEKLKMAYVKMDGPVIKEGDAQTDANKGVSPTNQTRLNKQIVPATFLNTSRSTPKNLLQPKVMQTAYPSGSDTLTASISVSNYTEFLAAVANTAISRIEFKNDIIADNRQPKTISRNLVVDGKGNLFNVTAHRNNNVFQLGNPAGSFKSQFILANMRIDYNGANRGKALIFVSDRNNVRWQISLEDIQSEGTATNHGRLVFNHSGTTILLGRINWQAATSKETDKSDRYGGVVNSAQIKITKNDEGKEPVIDMTANCALFRAYKGYSNQLTSMIIEAGVINLHSVNAQVLHMNDEVSGSAVVFHVKGQNTRLNVTASGGNSDALGGAISIIGNNWTGQAKGKSYTRIEEGAQVSIHSTDNARTKKAGAAFVNQVTHGVFYLTGEGTKMTCVADTPSNNIEAAFRFRVVGNQTFYMSDKAELKVVRNNGTTAGLRFYGPNNAFYISGGAKVLIDNLGKGDTRPSDGGDGEGRQGIQYPIDGGGTSIFDLKGKGSDVAVNARYGPALEGQNGAFKFSVSDQASISFIGSPKSAGVGALKLPSNSVDIKLDTPYFYEFRNNRPAGGPWLSGGNSRSIFKATNTELEVWKKGNNVNLDGPSTNSWTRMDYELSGVGFSKFNGSSNPNFNKATYGQASDYAKVAGGALEAEIKSLRQPTNADKHIYGHAVVPSTYDAINGEGAKRDAYTNEVWVKLRLYRLKFKKGVTSVQGNPSTSEADFNATYDVVTYEKEVPTIGHKNTTTGPDKELDGVKQFGEPKTYGIFEWDLTKDDRIKEDKFLWAGEYVEVIGVRRGHKTPRPGYDILTPKERYQDKGKYVFNVRPVEISTETITEGHIDPFLNLSDAKTTISDATKSIRFQANVKNMRKHAAVVPLPEGRKPAITGNPEFVSNGGISFYPMLSGKAHTLTNGSTADQINLYLKDMQNSQLNLYTYLSQADLSTDKTTELFAFSGWQEDISSLGKDLPPTYQTVTNITTQDGQNPFVLGGNNTTLAGLKMPTKTVKYHNETFKNSTQLAFKTFSPSSLSTTLSKQGGGRIDAVDLSKGQLVSYQVKLTNPNIQSFPDQLLLGYNLIFEITGNAEIFDGYGIDLPNGISETHDQQTIKFTGKGKNELGVGINIPVLVTGDFQIKVKGLGRTPQEKTLALPRSSWDVAKEAHNFASDGFTPGLQVPSTNDPSYLDYYRLLAAPDKDVSVSTSTTPINGGKKVYLSIADGKLTVYYRGLKQDSNVKVEVDGKALTTFKVDESDIEQAKPLNFKINGVRNIVKVSYTLLDGTTQTVTWKNPKITN